MITALEFNSNTDELNIKNEDLQKSDRVDNTLSVIDKILGARLAYANGIDFISDVEYDNLLQLVKNCWINYLTWETISSIDSLYNRAIYVLSQFGIKFEKQVDNIDTNDKVLYRSMFAEPMSMQMITDYGILNQKYLPQIHEVFCGMNEEVLYLFMGFKMDGWNISIYYDKNIVNESGEIELCYAHTRGRSSTDVKECTELMKMICPKLSVDAFISNETVLCITGELVLSKQGLEVINNESVRKYSNVRNIISSFVSGTIDIYKYSKYLCYFAFNLQSNVNIQRDIYISGIYNILYNWGFNTPPSSIITVNKSSFMYNDLVYYVEDMFHKYEDYYMNEYSKSFECDGVVLQPCNITYNNYISSIANGIFGDGLVAIKTGYWSKKIYTSKIVHIYYTRTKRNRSVMAIVEPVKSVLGQVITKVPLLNLQRCIQNDIHLGDTIKFTYHSNQIIEFLENISANDRLNKK